MAEPDLPGPPGSDGGTDGGTSRQARPRPQGL